MKTLEKQQDTAHFLRCWATFPLAIILSIEAIAWSWEFLTQVVGLDPDRLYPSIYVDDDEAFEIWNKEIGIPADRIFRFGKEDNFWEALVPAHAVHVLRFTMTEVKNTAAASRIVPLAVNVTGTLRYGITYLHQFDNDGHGNYSDLAQKNIDTGMGLERLAVVVQDVKLATVDTNKALLDRVCELAPMQSIRRIDRTDVSLRIVTDHIKSCTFMISDGIMPSNEGRGYVLRRLLRRAARHGRKLGIEGKFLARFEQHGALIALSKDGYPELEEKKANDFSKSFLRKRISLIKPSTRALLFFSRNGRKDERRRHQGGAFPAQMRLNCTIPMAFQVELNQGNLGRKGHGSRRRRLCRFL